MNCEWIKTELGGLYGQRLVEEQSEIIRLYEIYDGKGQEWTLPAGLDYTPTRKRTNLIKKLIKEEARFMMSKAPELKIVPMNNANKDAAAELEKWLSTLLSSARWQKKMIQAARDCFIGKRVALKLSGGLRQPLGVQFRPSLEFVFETDPGDMDRLVRVIFFWQEPSLDTEKHKQRIWRQRYWMDGVRCMTDEAIYDGYGKLIEERLPETYTGLDFIPVYIIINDGLTGDLSGESDVAELTDDQDAYNRLKSDDIDALKFNMFPQRVFTDYSQTTMDNIVIAPGATVDGQTDPSAQGRQGKAEMLESNFTYDARFENAISRIRGDMFDQLSVPNVSLEQLKGMMASGKSMKALYWGLISRVEEKWTEWDGALIWMVASLIKMAKAFGVAGAPPEVEHLVKVDHLYPLPDDDDIERSNDLAEVGQQARSRRSYISKWQKDADADGELVQIQKEQRAMDAYGMALDGELGGDPNGPKV